MTNPNPLEKDIEKRVCTYAKSLGFLCYKFTSPSKRSVPDRLCIAPDGHMFFIEFKRLGCTPTPAQTVEINTLRNMHVRVYVVDSVETGKHVIDLERI